MITMLKGPGTQHLILQCDGLLLKFSSNFNLRRYIVDLRRAALPAWRANVLLNAAKLEVARCRLILSNQR